MAMRVRWGEQSNFALSVGGFHPAYNPEPHLIAHSLVRQALEMLPPRRRAILLMYELEGTSIPTIARLLGINAVTVRWHLSIGRREMARSLGEARDE